MGVSHFVSSRAVLTFALFLSCLALSATAESECATNKDGENCNIMSDAFVQVRSRRSSIELSEEHEMQMQAAGEEKSMELHNQEANAIVRHNNTSGNKEVSMTDTKMHSFVDYVQIHTFDKNAVGYCLYYDAPNDKLKLSQCESPPPPEQAFHWDGDRFRTKSYYKCLDYSIHNNKVVMYTCNNQNNQKWELISDPHVSNGGQFLKSKHDHRCLDVGSLDLKSGADIIMRDCYAKMWGTRSGGNGNIESHQDSGKCLDYDYNSPIKNVIVYACNTGKNQVWSWHGQTLRSAYDSKCLDYSTSDSNALMWSCNNQANQEWNKERNGNPNKPGFALKSNDKSQGERCLEYGAYPNRDNTFMGLCRNATEWFLD